MTESAHVPHPERRAPRPLTDFIGRVRERTEVCRLLSARRLVTVTGAGGAGKTRLALAVADALPGRQHWVDLAAAGDDLVLPALLRAVTGGDVRGLDTVDDLVAELAGGPALLVLDTCEHLVRPLAPLVEALLVRCPQLTVLTTSRSPLHAAGERLWPIPPMSSDATVAAEHWPDGVALFVERARAVQPGFEVDDPAQSSIAAICARLDGNPLAIELCAARVGVLPVAQISPALDDALGLLVGRSPSAPDRQQTLRATLDWSHRLLTPDEARLFRRLSVFRAGASLDAVVAVTVDRTGVPGDRGTRSGEVVELLGGLVEHSLLRVVRDQGRARYELADAVRQYAAERLDQAGEASSCRDRHLHHFLSRAETPDRPASSPDAAFGTVPLEQELPNLRAALGWAQESGDWHAELALAAALAPVAIDHGHHREGRRWLDGALDHDRQHGGGAEGGSDPRVRAKALQAAGVLSFLQCDYPAATARLESARAAFGALGDDAGAASAVQALSGVVREQGDYGRAVELATTSLEFWRTVGDAAGTAGALTRLAFTALLRGDGPTAATLAAELLGLARRLADPGAATDAMLILGGAELLARDLGAASAHFEQALAVATDQQLVEALAYAEEGLGWVALLRGDLDAAVPRLQSSLRRQHELGDRWRTASLLVELATCRRLRGEPAAAARTLAAADALLEEIGGALPPAEHAHRSRTLYQLRQSLTPDELDRARTAGGCVSLTVAVAEALADWGPEPPTRPARSEPQGLPPVPLKVRIPSPAAERTEAPLTLRTLGRELVVRSGQTLGPADFSYAKPRELLFYLAYAGPVTKADIGLALWPEAGAGPSLGTTLRSAFHTTLHHLRRAVGSERIIFVDGCYRLDPDGLDDDVAAFSGALTQARSASSRSEELRALRRATGLYAGDYLPATTSEWTGALRDELRDRHRRALLATGRILAAGGGHAGAIDAFRRVTVDDPFSETAYRELMRCYDTIGEPSQALRAYERLADTLRAELGTAPGGQTSDLHEQIRARVRV